MPEAEATLSMRRRACSAPFRGLAVSSRARHCAVDDSNDRPIVKRAEVVSGDDRVPRGPHWVCGVEVSGDYEDIAESFLVSQRLPPGAVAQVYPPFNLGNARYPPGAVHQIAQTLALEFQLQLADDIRAQFAARSTPPGMRGDACHRGDGPRDLQAPVAERPVVGHCVVHAIVIVELERRPLCDRGHQVPVSRRGAGWTRLEQETVETAPVGDVVGPWLGAVVYVDRDDVAARIEQGSADPATARCLDDLGACGRVYSDLLENEFTVHQFPPSSGGCSSGAPVMLTAPAKESTASFRDTLRCIDHGKVRLLP